MQIIRTFVWVLLTAVIVAFVAMNWTPVSVRIWDGLVVETKLAALVLGAFLLGLVPVWLFAKAGRWRLLRRLSALENSIRAAETSIPGVPASTAPAPLANDLPGT